MAKRKSVTKPHSVSKSRYKAALSLLDWLKSGQIVYADLKDFETAKDHGLYRHIVSNVIRHKNKLEFIASHLTNRPKKKIDVEAIVSILIGLVQLTEDSKVEPYAAINESVELAKALKKPHLKGFINAALRRYSRERDTINSLIQQQSLEIKSSHSKAQIKRWKQFYGKEAVTEICGANNLFPSVQVVINPEFETYAIIEDLQVKGYQLNSIHEKGFTVMNPSGLFATEWAVKGALLVQDRSFQVLTDLLMPVSKENVLDACSSPGGKLIHLEWSFSESIKTLLACEPDINRLKVLKDNLNLFNSKALVIRADSTKPPLRQMFDFVICDAPCSGTGTIRKHPEIKWTRDVSDFLRNQKTQLKLLSSLAEVLLPNGHLLYVTCSIEKEENQDVVSLFLDRFKDQFELIPFDQSNETQVPSNFTSEGFYQALPSETQMGAFAALLKKSI